MIAKDLEIWNCFIDPQTKLPLKPDTNRNALEASDGIFPIKDGVIDFYTKLPPYSCAGSDSEECFNKTADIDLAPELRASHEAAFERTVETGGNIYGSIEDLPKITQSGHYRRMAILQDLDLGDLQNKTVVDFGTGPWGFGAIFPKLRTAKQCIGFDVSRTALEMARNVESSFGRSEHIVFATSDGDVIPLADNSIGVFFGGEVIEHVRHPRIFLQEIARVCKHNAIVILTTPNKDALYYRLQFISYCVGPEHIALLSFSQFRDFLSYFTEGVEIYGYETSLGPGLDQVPIDKTSCELIQSRAYRFPELSTGMISLSRVCKQKLKANQIEWILREAIWSSDTFVYKIQPDTLKLFADIDGALLVPGNEATLTTTANQVFLLFWGHNWSGFVEIIIGDNVIVHDLYSPHGGFIRIDVNVDRSVSFIRIRSNGQKRESSESNQVILYKVVQYEIIS